MPKNETPIIDATNKQTSLIFAEPITDLTQMQNSWEIVPRPTINKISRSRSVAYQLDIKGEAQSVPKNPIVAAVKRVAKMQSAYDLNPSSKNLKQLEEAKLVVENLTRGAR